MAVKIRPLGTLKTYINNQSEIEVEAGRSIRDTVKALGIPPEIVALVLVNDTQQDKNYIAQDGDAVKLMAVIGGG